MWFKMTEIPTKTPTVDRFVEPKTIKGRPIPADRAAYTVDGQPYDLGRVSDVIRYEMDTASVVLAIADKLKRAIDTEVAEALPDEGSAHARARLVAEKLGYVKGVLSSKKPGLYDSRGARRKAFYEEVVRELKLALTEKDLSAGEANGKVQTGDIAERVAVGALTRAVR